MTTISSRRRRTLGALASVVLVLTACGSDDTPESADATTADATTAETAAPTTEPPATEPPATEPPTTEPPATEAPAEPLTIMVTNDDGVGAEGIDALVEGLLTLDDVEVVVVAPAENQSGSAGKTTDGELVSAETTTTSGHPAIAVTGFPADSVIWALDQGGVDVTPDLVVSGINEGQNIGPLIDLSGTVGAARAAANRGIPAIAVSQGIGNETVDEDYPAAVEVVLAWIEENRDLLLADGDGFVVSFNVPTCVNGGSQRGIVEVPHGADLGTVDIVAGVDCTSTLETPANDVEAFVNGFIAKSDTPLEPATPS